MSTAYDHPPKRLERMMGMFDYVNFECVCPVCKSKVDGFQTKDGDCVLDVVEPTEVSNFYSSCGKCGCWIDYTAKPVKLTNFIQTVKGKHNKTVGRVILHEHTKEVTIV